MCASVGLIKKCFNICLSVFSPFEAKNLQNRWEKLCRNDRQANDAWLRWWRWILTKPQGLIAPSASSILDRKHFFPYFMDGWRKTGKFIVQPSACGRRQILLSLLYCTWNLSLCFCTAPRDLRLGSAAARLLGLWVRIPPPEWMPLACERCVLSRRDLCVGLITPTEESYRVWCVWVCVPFIMRRPWPIRGCCDGGKISVFYFTYLSVVHYTTSCIKRVGIAACTVPRVHIIYALLAARYCITIFLCITLCSMLLAVIWSALCTQSM